MVLRSEEAENAEGKSTSSRQGEDFSPLRPGSAVNMEP